MRRWRGLVWRGGVGARVKFSASGCYVFSSSLRTFSLGYRLYLCRESLQSSFKLNGGPLAGCSLCATCYAGGLLRQLQQAEQGLIHRLGVWKSFCNSRIQQSYRRTLHRFFVKLPALQTCEVGAFVFEQNLHYAGASALRAACSRTARAYARLPTGNHSTNWLINAPSSRFSKSAATGTRVPRKSQAPL